MRIGIDLSITKINQAGTGIYAASIYSALQALDTAHTFVPFIINRERAMGQPKTLVSRIGTLYQDLIWGQALVPFQAARHKVDLLHIPTGLAPLVKNCPTVLSIMDVSVLKMPQYFPAWQRTYARVVLPRSARQAKAILTISEFSKKEIVEWLQVPPERVAVTYLSVSPKFCEIDDVVAKELLAPYHLESPFILTVGTLEPRKNITGLLKAFATLKKNGCTHQLVHVGSKGWLYDDILELVHELNLVNDVHFLGRQPLDTLVAFYNQADVFVYPSLYEGFGLPVLEAMNCGCPVVTSNVSSLPEVIGEAGLQVNPLDTQEIATAIEKVLNDKDLAIQMRQNGLMRAREFSWQRCAQETIDVYEQVVGRSS
ncbi:glycosyltransferase family 4 protein [Chloroflexota bacterium]